MKIAPSSEEVEDVPRHGLKDFSQTSKGLFDGDVLTRWQKDSSQETVISLMGMLVRSMASP